MSEFWKNARSLMDEQGLRQADVARGVGVPKATVFNWLKRDTIPQADCAVKIADLLGTTVRYLVTGARQEYELSPLEKRLIEACRGLSDPMLHKVIKEAVDLRIMAEQEKGVGSPGGSASETG